jgi:hypothetical protein
MASPSFVPANRSALTPWLRWVTHTRPHRPEPFFEHHDGMVAVDDGKTEALGDLGSWHAHRLGCS